MYEIEVKAHVTDRETVRAALARFAIPAGTVDKRDFYWKRKDGSMTVRVREEYGAAANSEAGNSTLPHRTLVTYKKKERRRYENADGGERMIEVNDETEFTVSDGAAFCSLLSDAGFAVALTKQKLVERWECSAQVERSVSGAPLRHESECSALLELCTVPPLGDFLEIEIMSEVDDEATVSAIRNELESLLVRAGVPLDAIEKRYYSDMLKENTGVPVDAVEKRC